VAEGKNSDAGVGAPINLPVAARLRQAVNNSLAPRKTRGL